MHCKKLIREQQKISPPVYTQTSKPTANQVFYNTLSKIISNNTLQNKIATMELQIFEAKKSVL